MPSEVSLEVPVFQIRILTTEPKFPGLGDVTSFLYDLNLLYEILRLAIDSNYKDFQFSSRVGYRNGRTRLDNRDRLHIQSLRMDSPMDFVAFLQVFQLPITLTAIAAFIGSVEKIYLLKPKSRLLNAQAQELEDKHLRAHDEARVVRAQAEKAERENRQAALKEFEYSRAAFEEEFEEWLQHLKNRGALKSYSNASNRLRKSKIQIVSIEVDYIDNETPEE